MAEHTNRPARPARLIRRLIRARATQTLIILAVMIAALVALSHGRQPQHTEPGWYPPGWVRTPCWADGGTDCYVPPPGTQPQPTASSR